ncbi:hypothetical protein U1Q18_018215 [Sarracenia purpurea var. burkii]
MLSAGRELGRNVEQDLLIDPCWCWTTYGQSSLASLRRTCQACSLPTSLRQSGVVGQSLPINRYRVVQESNLETKRSGLHRTPSGAVVAFWVLAISQCPLLALLRPHSWKVGDGLRATSGALETVRLGFCLSSDSRETKELFLLWPVHLTLFLSHRTKAMLLRYHE